MDGVVCDVTNSAHRVCFWFCVIVNVCRICDTVERDLRRYRFILAYKQCSMRYVISLRSKCDREVALYGCKDA